MTRPKVEIRYPVDDTRVNYQEDVGGTAENIPDNYELWVLIYSQEKRQYCPWGKIEPNNNDWIHTVNIGSENDYERKFDIIAVLADKNAQSEFIDYLNKVDEDENNTLTVAMYDIPDGTKTYDKVTVKRNKEAFHW